MLPWRATTPILANLDATYIFRTTVNRVGATRRCGNSRGCLGSLTRNDGRRAPPCRQGGDLPALENFRWSFSEFRITSTAAFLRRRTQSDDCCTARSCSAEQSPLLPRHADSAHSLVDDHLANRDVQHITGRVLLVFS